jgi:hypothetical protein
MPEDTGACYNDQLAVSTCAQGCGTYAGSLWEGFPSERVFANDLLPAAECRYMESFETKHSDHALAAGIASEIGLELPSLRLDSQAKYGECTDWVPSEAGRAYGGGLGLPACCRSSSVWPVALVSVTQAAWEAAG